MHRTYLYVPPEEKTAVEAQGAKWDHETKRWYIEAQQPHFAFTRWLLVDDEAPEFNIISDRAFVAAAKFRCLECSRPTEVICIYCESGFVLDEPLTNFSLSHITAMCEGLQEQLRTWPNFQKTAGGLFVNRCHNCGARCDDLYLHTEPGDLFFDLPSGSDGSIELTPIAGTIQLSGDEHFQVD